MSIFNEYIEDFHYYVGRKLGIKQKEIRLGLEYIIGKPSNIQNHYEALKKYANTNTKRDFILEILKFKIADFMGTQICEDDYKIIDKNYQNVELDKLESYLKTAFDPDGDWNEWRKMIVNFGLSTPNEEVDLTDELKRLRLPVCYAKKINSKAIKFYSPDRRFRNLAFTVLASSENEVEFETAQKIMMFYLISYYREMGINLKLENCAGEILTRKKNKAKPESTILPFLPKLPCEWHYCDEFYEYVRNIVRGEQNLFKIEWGLVKTIRLSHHSVIVHNLDRCSNDFLEGVKSIKDLLLMSPFEPKEQNDSLILIKGDVGEMFLSNFSDDCGFEKEEEFAFIRNWYEHDPEYVIISISKCYKDGTLDKNKMRNLVRQRFSNNLYTLRHLKTLCVKPSRALLVRY